MYFNNNKTLIYINRVYEHLKLGLVVRIGGENDIYFICCYVCLWL